MPTEKIKISSKYGIEQIAFDSIANDWECLSQDILQAIERLEVLNSKSHNPILSNWILTAISDDFSQLSIIYCDESGNLFAQNIRQIIIKIPHQLSEMNENRDDDILPPNGTIDRAICHVAFKMYSWHKAPETFELITKVRYKFYIKWGEKAPDLVNEFAYEIW